jgi:hypothetical protein
MATGQGLTFSPLTPQLMAELHTVLRGSFGASCWCMHPRLTNEQLHALPGSGSLSERRRAAMTSLAGRDCAPGLLAFEGAEPVGWIAVAPRSELARVDASRVTPPVDELDVWSSRASPCARGPVAAALIRAAVTYAAEHGAPAVEAYPRAGADRTADDNIYFGIEPLFRRAGFQVVREPLANRPKNAIPRLAMRISTGP